MQRIKDIADFWGLRHLEAAALLFKTVNVKMLPTSRGCAFTGNLIYGGRTVASFENQGNGEMTAITWNEKKAEKTFMDCCGNKMPDTMLEGLMEVSEIR